MASFTTIWVCFVFTTELALPHVEAFCRFKNNHDQINVTCRKETKFPSGIPQNAFLIDLSHCKISSLQRKDLQSFSQLRIFRIAGSQLRTIENTTFDHNQQLNVLDLSRNSNINSDTTKTFICHLARMNRNVRELYLSVMNITTSDFYDIIRCLEKTQLTVLDLSSTIKGSLKNYTFSKMKSLRVLKLGSIYPVNLRALVNLTLLNTLRLSDTKLEEIPSFYDRDTNATLLPSLTALYLDANYIARLPSKSVGLDNLEFMSMRSNRLMRFTASDISTLSTKLNTLFFNTNKGIHIEECSFSESVTRLELRDCRIAFSRNVRTIFRTATHMTGLSLTKNTFDQSDDALGTIFHPMPNLTHLSLEYCSIKHIPDTTFQGLHRLIMLTLRGNRISKLSSKHFRDLHSLESLNLAENKLTMVYEDVIKSFPPSLKAVDFAQNPFVCTCDLLWFMKLFRGGRIVFLETDTNDAYKCYNPAEMAGKKLTSFEITDADCVHMSLGVKLIIMISGIVCFVALITLVVYRFRWYIGYGYFLLRARRREAMEVSGQTQYAYDAFVAYNKNDLTWVKDELLPLLEDEAHLRLCVHDRDWLCGRDVIDNIVQSIESSRKTLLIVSNAFAASQWCQLEMTLAQHRLLAEDRNALVLVLMEPIERRNVTPRLILQMRQQTYLEWTDDPVGQKLFWKKLLRSLKKQSGSIVHSSSVDRPKPEFSEDGIEPGCVDVDVSDRTPLSQRAHV